MKNLISGIFASTIVAFCAGQSFAACGNQSGAAPKIAEIVTFKLAKGIDDSTFLNTVSKMENAYLCNVKGFVRRTLAKAEDGTWIDHVEWASMSDAMAAMEGSMKEPSVAPFLQSIDPETLAVKHWQILKKSN